MIGLGIFGHAYFLNGKLKRLDDFVGDSRTDVRADLKKYSTDLKDEIAGAKGDIREMHRHFDRFDESQEKDWSASEEIIGERGTKE